MKKKIKKEKRRENSFTSEDIKKVYRAGYRNGSRDGMRLLYTGELNVTTFDEYFSKRYKIE